jgi:hypothetical protein
MDRVPEPDPFILHPDNQLFLMLPRPKLLPGFFAGARFGTWVTFLVLILGTTIWVVQHWHATAMLTAPFGVRTDAQVERLWTEHEEETTFHVSYSYAPYQDDRLLRGQDRISPKVYESLRNGGSVRICYAMSEPTFSKTFSNCEDPPILSSLFLLWLVSFFVLNVIKDESLRRGRLLPGKIEEINGAWREGVFRVRVRYRFSTPKGRTMVGKARYRRNDLGKDPARLPLPGTPILVQYTAAYHYPV